MCLFVQYVAGSTTYRSFHHLCNLRTNGWTFPNFKRKRQTNLVLSYELQSMTLHFPSQLQINNRKHFHSSSSAKKTATWNPFSSGLNLKRFAGNECVQSKRSQISLPKKNFSKNILTGYRGSNIYKPLLDMKSSLP